MCSYRLLRRDDVLFSRPAQRGIEETAISNLLCLAVISATALLAANAAPAADAKFPNLVKIVVPFPPGGSNDVVARAIAAPLAKRLDTTVIVDNKPGASGVIGNDAVAKGPRDASVLLLTSSTFLTVAATQAKLPYDAVSGFAPVAMVAEGPLLLAVASSMPAKTPADLIAAARAKPGALTYGSAGIGSVGHMATELFTAAAKIQMTHVAYKGAANAIVDLAGGQIHAMISNYSSLVSQLNTGRVRALAVTSKQASPVFPDLPPLAAAVPDFSMDIWISVFAPAGTPPVLVERLNRELREISASPELRVFLEPDGALPVSISPALLAARLKDELARWKAIAAERKIVTE
jgi:tripartite-type tricarboxylate transporter receptor subunit TctC